MLAELAGVDLVELAGNSNKLNSVAPARGLAGFKRGPGARCLSWHPFHWSSRASIPGRPRHTGPGGPSPAPIAMALQGCAAPLAPGRRRRRWRAAAG